MPTPCEHGVDDAGVAVEHPRPGRRRHDQRQQPRHQEQRPQRRRQPEVAGRRTPRAPGRSRTGRRSRPTVKTTVLMQRRARTSGSVKTVDVVVEPDERRVAVDERADRVVAQAQVEVAVQRVGVEDDQVDRRPGRGTPRPPSCAAPAAGGRLRAAAGGTAPRGRRPSGAAARRQPGGLSAVRSWRFLLGLRACGYLAAA